MMVEKFAQSSCWKSTKCSILKTWLEMVAVLRIFWTVNYYSVLNNKKPVAISVMNIQCSLIKLCTIHNPVAEKNPPLADCEWIVNHVRFIKKRWWMWLIVMALRSWSVEKENHGLGHRSEIDKEKRPPHTHFWASKWMHRVWPYCIIFQCLRHSI